MTKPEHDATRRAQSRFAAGSLTSKPIPFAMLDDPQTIPSDFKAFAPDHDAVNHPRHYTGHPSRVECIQITEHMNFCLGNAVKYIWRADLKADAIEDLKKAAWYIQREIERRSKA